LFLILAEMYGFALSSRIGWCLWNAMKFGSNFAIMFSCHQNMAVLFSSMGFLWSNILFCN
jgi:hypothetical protein